MGAPDVHDHSLRRGPAHARPYHLHDTADLDKPKPGMALKPAGALAQLGRLQRKWLNQSQPTSLLQMYQSLPQGGLFAAPSMRAMLPQSAWPQQWRDEDRSEQNARGNQSEANFRQGRG